MLKLNENHLLSGINQEWYNNLNKIHNKLLGYTEATNIDNREIKIVESDRAVGATCMLLSIIFNYATNNRNKKIVVVSTKYSMSKEVCELTKDLFAFEGITPINKNVNSFTIFNGTIIEFISQDKYLGQMYDLCIFDCAMRISYSNFFKFTSFCKKTIINFTSGMLPAGIINLWTKEFVEENKVEIPFTIRGLLDAQSTLKWVSNTNVPWKEQGYILGYKDIINMFKEYI